MSKLSERLLDAVTLLTGVSALVVAVVVVSGGTTSDRPTVNSPEVDDWEQYAQSGHWRGSPDAPVVVVEFGDYECPFCQAAETRIRAILEEYEGEVAFIYRHNPLRAHSRAYSAAQAAECAGLQGAFWPYHELLYAREAWRTGDAEQAFAALAVEAGVPDEGAFLECIANDTPGPKIAADREAAAAIGFTGTPGFLINHQRHLGTTALEPIYFEEILRQIR